MINQSARKFSIRTTFAMALLAVAVAGGCKKEKIGVRIDCKTPSRAAVECEVHQTTGKAAAEACWDLTATCPNGTKVTAPRQCQKVKDGGTETLTIPADTMDNVDACDGPPKLAVTNLTINGKKAQ